MEISDEMLQNILADVDAVVKPMIKNATEKLNKADEEEESEPAEESSPAPEASPAGPPEASAAPAPEASPAAPAPEASPAAPAGPPAGAEGGIPDDPAALMDMFSQLPPQKIKAIYMAAKQALISIQGGQAGGPPSSAGAPPAPAGPPPGAPPAMKAEMKSSPGNGGKVLKNENEEINKILKNQNEKIELLTQVIQKMAGTPVRKAVTSVTQLNKSETTSTEVTMSKSEISSKLSEVIKSGNLNKSEREKIRKYYDNGCKDVSLIASFMK